MELTINDQKIKELLSEILVEMFKENKEEFKELLLDAMEEIGLLNAIKEGRQNNFVNEEKILEILDA